MLRFGLLVAAFRWKPDAYSVVAFAVGYENPFMITREVEAQAGAVLRHAPGQ